MSDFQYGIFCTIFGVILIFGLCIVGVIFHQSWKDAKEVKARNLLHKADCVLVLLEKIKIYTKDLINANEDIEKLDTKNFLLELSRQNLLSFQLPKKDFEVEQFLQKLKNKAC